MTLHKLMTLLYAANRRTACNIVFTYVATNPASGCAPVNGYIESQTRDVWFRTEDELINLLERIKS